MRNDAERLLKLEEETAHLRMTNDELSAEVLKQWKRIENLELKLKQFEGQLAGLEDRADLSTDTTKPPHW
ncbi:MAG: SlyX family protein [Pseudomonadota bacterium]